MLDCVAEASFAPATTLENIRSTLELYLEALEELRNKNAERADRRFKTKSFVEDTRYAAMKAREGERRLDAATIATHFETLTMTGRNIAVLDEEIAQFSKLQELTVSENKLTDLAHLPASLKVLIANGNSLTRALPERSVAPNLVFLSVADNRIDSLGFIESMPSLVSLDVSFNRVTSIEGVIEPVLEHPRVRDLNLLGNPVAFLPLYRIHILEICEELLILDGQDADRSPPAVLPKNDMSCVVRIELSKVSGISCLAVPPTEDREQESLAQRSGAKPAAKDRTKGKKLELATSAAPAPTTVVSLVANWIPVEGLTVEAFGLTPSSADAHTPHPPVGGKVSVARPNKSSKLSLADAGAAVPGGPFSALDDLVVEAEVECDVPLYDNLVMDMLHPLHVSMYLFQGVSEEGTDESGVGVSSTSSLQGEKVGSFEVQLSQLVGWVSGGNAYLGFSDVPFVVDSEFVAVKTQRLKELRSTHADLVSLLQRLEEASREANAAAEPVIAALRPTPQKKAPSRLGNSNKPDSQSPAPQETLEALQCRTEVDAVASQLIFEEKQLARVLDAVLTLSGSVEINPYPPTIQAETSQVDVEVDPKKKAGNSKVPGKKK